ncbi:MbnP family protein [Flavisolibacter tropicus]|uniref:Copper-binding protein MbnP-like domain-containing protein n=1 Tax=Flavisolibacter tropicus TaxID=1492898 RepID=A0A172TZJ4_9BACT|nr:MbnP family protein [Flavisolibacter tropicus]ANE52529.1 hypothetical protein SY85_20640 [Flavisolibacter tropicus]
MMRLLTSITIVCLLLFTNSCKKEKSATDDTGAFLEIQLVNQVNGQPLQLNKTLTNSFQETFTLTEYKYYVSNLELLNPSKNFKASDTYFLVNEQSADSKTLKTTIRADAYDGLVFLVGIDSTRQVSGNHTGVLDPAQGMYWDANEGYMAAKMEGTSDFSGAPGNVLRHEIGGFEGQTNALRYVIIPFPATMVVNQGQTLKLTIKAELLRWFDGIYPMSIADNPTILNPGTAAMKIADNYSGQFSLSSIDVK